MRQFKQIFYIKLTKYIQELLWSREFINSKLNYLLLQPDVALDALSALINESWSKDVFPIFFNMQ